LDANSSRTDALLEHFAAAYLRLLAILNQRAL
jgi:hypothetical protein